MKKDYTIAVAGTGYVGLFKEWGSDKNGVIYREKRVLWLCSMC